MKPFTIAVLMLVLIFVGMKVYSFWGQEKQLSRDLADIEARLAAAKTNEANLQSDVKYLTNPLNLEKEIRSRFNYKKQGETMVVIVSDQSSTASSSSGQR